MFPTENGQTNNEFGSKKIFTKNIQKGVLPDMKKFLKFLCSAAVLCATVAGGIFAYKKFFAPGPFDDDFEEDSSEVEITERGYVSLSPSEEEAAKESDQEETAEE